MPTIICVLFACAHTLRLGDTAAKTKGLQPTISNKGRVQDSPVLTYTIKYNVLIKYKYYHSPTSPRFRPHISSFGHLVRDQDNLTPSLYRSSQLSRLYCVIRVFSQYPHSLPHPIIRGPFTPQDANPIKYSFPDFQYTTVTPP